MFHDRHDAAVRLARELRRFKGRADALVLAVPRGGLPIGAVLSAELGLPLDVILTKKIGHPYNPEFAIGAVSLTGETYDEELVRREGIRAEWLAGEIARVRGTLRERYRLYHGSAEPLSVAGKTVILTDDGAATGRTLIVAVDLLRGAGAAKVVVAIPVAPPDAVELLEAAADEVVCLEEPPGFMAIGEHYADFSQVSDEQAVACLKTAGAAGTRP
ncbi:MAG: phosphoribosyltransferase [Elusimicrobia bacterium]|nr:phosphoribosyltransferase [Elusimicrobiota bacterium]